MVVVVQIGGVAAHVTRHALRRITLPQPGADIHGVRVVPDPDFSPLRGWPPFERLLLQKVGHRVVVVVQPLVEAAVEIERFGRADRADRDVAGFVA
jgi:hypothetical protein